MKKLELDLNMSERGPEMPLSGGGDHYPTIHFEGPEELGLPEHGTMLVHYKVKREVETKTPQGDWYSCDIEVRKILGVEAEKDIRPSKRDTSAEDALDNLMRQHDDETESD